MRRGMFGTGHGKPIIEKLDAETLAAIRKPDPCQHRRDADLLQAASQVPYLLEHYPADSSRLEDYASELQDECNCDKA